jgi:malate synthase
LLTEEADMARTTEALVCPEGVTVPAPVSPEYASILTPEALAFIAALQREFGPRRDLLLRRRAERQVEFDSGKLPDFLPDTASVRAADWTIAALPQELQDRRVEITGPVERKMIINALNSGANVFMADFEDSLTPTWDNLIHGQINLRDAVRRAIDFESPDGKFYKLNDRVAVLFMRPRGWHLSEKHVSVDGQPMSGSLFDFGLHFFHNAKALIERGSGPYFYLPKMESHIEARLWNDVFVRAQQMLHPGTSRPRSDRNAAGGLRDGRMLHELPSIRPAWAAGAGITFQLHQVRNSPDLCWPTAGSSAWRRRSCAPRMRQDLPPARRMPSATWRRRFDQAPAS